MFQLSGKQIDKIFDYVMATVVIVALSLSAFLFATLYNAEVSPYSDVCWQMKEQFVGLSRSNCIDYLNDNPGATGQDVLDHYDMVTIEQIVENPVDDLLEKPIIPVK